MTYNYVCPKCTMQSTISKPMSESDRVEHCELCKGELKRVWEVPSIKTADNIKI